MSYEKTAITSESTPIMPSSTPIMKEERVVDPYSSMKRAAKIAESVQAKAPIGQQIIKRDELASAPEESNAGLPEETVTLSPQMAALARKEQKFRQRELEFKKNAEALEAEKAEIAELKALKAKLANKDYSGLENLVKYDEYTQYLIEKDSALSPEQQAVKKLAEEVEGLKTAQKDDLSQRFEAAVNERRKAVTQLVETNPEFASIKKAKMQEAVVQHILDTWEHDSRELSPEEAAKEVKQVLLDKALEWKTLLEEVPAIAPDQAEEAKKQLPPLKAGIKTLTNNMTASSEVKRPLKSLSHMSDSERYAEARRRAEEKLKLQQQR